MIKLNRSCPWVYIAQVTKPPTIITEVPAKGHTGSLPSTSLDHHISMLVASRGNLSFTDPIWCFRDVCPSMVGHAVAVVRSSQSRGKPSSRNHGEEICHDPCHAKFVAIAADHEFPLTNLALTAPRYKILRVLNRLFLYSCSKAEHPPMGDHSCTIGNRLRNLRYDSWSFSHLGYLHQGTTPQIVKLDHHRRCPWV